MLGRCALHARCRRIYPSTDIDINAMLHHPSRLVRYIHLRLMGVSQRSNCEAIYSGLGVRVTAISIAVVA